MEKKKKNRGRKRVNISIPAELHGYWVTECDEMGVTFSAVVEKLLFYFRRQCDRDRNGDQK